MFLYCLQDCLSTHFKNYTERREKLWFPQILIRVWKFNSRDAIFPPVE